MGQAPLCGARPGTFPHDTFSVKRRIVTVSLKLNPAQCAILEALPKRSEQAQSIRLAWTAHFLDTRLRERNEAPTVLSDCRSWRGGLRKYVDRAGRQCRRFLDASRWSRDRR